ncbi:hypothetical protein [Actinoallomurus sp. NPDC050550]|uniref:hypothetical protein n=1 Tax=Actinoallomurus sp. NPDC050550 TaxID=3154937 RepID=UPI0033F4F199
MAATLHPAQAERPTAADLLTALTGGTPETAVTLVTREWTATTLPGLQTPLTNRDSGRLPQQAHLPAVSHLPQQTGRRRRTGLTIASVLAGLAVIVAAAAVALSFSSRNSPAHWAGAKYRHLPNLMHGMHGLNRVSRHRPSQLPRHSKPDARVRHTHDVLNPVDQFRRPGIGRPLVGV